MSSTVLNFINHEPLSSHDDTFISFWHLTSDSATTSPPVWPSPVELSLGENIVWIRSDVPFLLACANISKGVGHRDQADCGHNSWTKDLYAEFQPLLFNYPLIPEKFHPLHQEFEPSVAARRMFVEHIVVTITECQQEDAVEPNEEYKLQLTSDDDGAYIKCAISSFNGGYYALQTLRQLLYKHSKTSELVLYTPYAPVVITDKPRFSHRGLNLDIARNRISPGAVMRKIDGKAATKLNRLHLHATDAQSWPLEISALPELARRGAYHPSQTWTCAILENVQKHGKRRGVEVFIEIDTPGHTASTHHSFPELITAYNQQPWQPYAEEPPSGPLKLNSAPVHDFLKILLGDLLPHSAKFSRYFHIGGDEINAKACELDPGIRSSSPDVIRPGLQVLVDVVLAKVSQTGLTPVAWEELLLDWNIELPKSTIIQVWRSHERLASVVERGHRAIFGPSTQWYLDGSHGAWVDPDRNNKDTPVKSRFIDWCSPYKNWRQVCSYDPFDGVPADLHHLIHGGEVHLWAELTADVTLDSKLWPRAATAAETLWARRGKVDEHMTRRLAEFIERLVLQGIGASVAQMEWSLRNFGGSLM